MRQNPIKIMNAQTQDIDDLVKLLQQLFSIEKDFTFDPEKHKKGLRMMLDGCGKHRVVKVAWLDRQIVGMCTAQSRISTASGSLTAVLEDLVVDARYRGNGFGTALLNEMEQWAQRLGIQHLSLLADRENTLALTFYSLKKWKQTRMISLTKAL
ncbi:MAG: GNAT family N-acetyltransferase [Pseudomonadota bacterium]